METFNELPIPASPVTGNLPVDGPVSTYLVYDSPKTYKRVEAASVNKAIKLAGIEKPLRVVRECMFNKVLLDNKVFE